MNISTDMTAEQLLAAGTFNVRAVLRNNNPHSAIPLGKVCLVAEADGVWKLPGGNPEASETPVQAMRREIKEELAQGISELFFVGSRPTDDGTNLRILYGGEVDADTIVVNEASSDPEKIAFITWVDETNVPDGKHKNHILTAMQMETLARQERIIG